MLSREIRELEHVPRWSIVRVIKRQSVAEHSYFTAMYAHEIAVRIGWASKYPDHMGQLTAYALWHDAEECFMSDIPGPIKRGVVNKDKYKQFSMEQSMLNWQTCKEDKIRSAPQTRRREIRDIVKCASTMEELFYLMGEIQMGNSTVKHVAEVSHTKMLHEWEELPFIANFQETATAHMESIVRNNYYEKSRVISKVELEREAV